MVKGEDPVVFEMQTAFKGKTIQETQGAADAGLTTTGWFSGIRSLKRQADYAMDAEKNRPVLSDVYMHVPYLTQISSWTPKVGLIKGVDHDPGLFRDKIIGAL